MNPPVGCATNGPAPCGWRRSSVLRDVSRVALSATGCLAGRPAAPPTARVWPSPFGQWGVGGGMRISDTSDLWWKTAVVYCLDVETFMDWDDDGVGDFVGLSERL